MRNQKSSHLLLILVVLVPLALAYAQVPTVTLRDKAQASGNYVTYAPPDTSPTYSNLTQVTAASPTVITGTIGQNRAALTPDGTFVHIVYDVTVQEVLKGKRSLIGSVIKVGVPGGKVAFKGADNQTYYAEVRTPWFKKMESGKQYYLFLIPWPESSTVSTTAFQTAGGPQGIFEIAGTVVKSNSGRLRDPIWQYHNMAEATFKNQVKLAIQTTDPPLPLPSPVTSP